MRLFVDTRGIPNTLALGAAGLVGGMAALFGHMLRTNEYTKKWSNPNSWMIKMFLAAFKLPGWEGGVREPCLMPDEAEISAFGEGLLALDVPEFFPLTH